jgi:hypothetical protein
VPSETREVRPGPGDRSLLTLDGQLLVVPAGWSLLPPGDAALSGRVKKQGPCWIVKEKRGRKVFSRGIWAPSERIEKVRRELAIERSLPAYTRKLEAGRARRDKEQAAYAREFELSVFAFLDFDPRHRELGQKMARAISNHAVPVGSGTVARTRRISVEQRAEAAAIAWMRHQTTAYEHMNIPRVMGKRREVRRLLAQHSRSLLNRYRNGELPAAGCPLIRALD